MNYVYDILTNFNENLYEFYDWNLNDNITHIRKIPAFKVSEKEFLEMKNNIVEFSEEFKETIKNKTEFFQGRGIKILKYAFLITNGVDIIGILIDSKLKYTSLQIDEELDILDGVRFKECSIHYTIQCKKEPTYLKTRKQIQKERQIKEQLSFLAKENNSSKIKYIYYECFNKKESKVQNMLNLLNNSLDDKTIYKKLNNFFELNKQIN